MDETSLITARLNVRGLKKVYGESLVLKDVNLSVNAGKTLAIIGRSGCGKSTLLKCLCALERADEGEADLDQKPYLSSGVPLIPPWKIRSDIVMVFQEFALFPNLTGLGNIVLALEKSKRVPRKEAKDMAIATADKLGISSILDRFPNEMSGGQAQRLALARAMVLNPKVLLLDEITSALDPETIVNVIDAIRSLRQTPGNSDLSIILVTHLMRFAEEFSDRIVFLHQGETWEELPSHQFFNHCKRQETQRFIAPFEKLF